MTGCENHAKFFSVKLNFNSISKIRRSYNSKKNGQEKSDDLEETHGEEVTIFPFHFAPS